MKSNRIENFFLLLMAPPASGKTYFLQSLFDAGVDILYLSPLRAIASEVSENFESAFWLDCRQKWKEFFQSSAGQKQNRKFLVSTVECSLGRLDQLDKSFVVVFDEIHLFYQWGASFRPHLREMIEEVGGLGLSIIGLSATINPLVFAEIEKDSDFAFDVGFKLDFGNHQLKYMPAHWLVLPADQYHFLLYLLEKRRFMVRIFPILVFLRYRDEVRRWQKRLCCDGFNVVSCVGGETEAFAQQMKQGGNVQVILATIALSHGVNLPEIGNVFLTYPVQDRGMLWQMIARGGRKGGDYAIYSVGSCPRKWHLETMRPGFFKNIFESLVFRWWRFWRQL